MGGYKFSITLLCAVLVSGLAALIPLAWIGARTLSSSYRESAARETTSSARMLALALASGETARSPGELARRVRQAREASGARFTIIGRDGTVIADSDENADRMENHLNRPEVQAAIAGGAGSAGMEIRSSPTLGTEWMYVAITPD
ncbi:MAG: hypothetical protein LIP23_09060, partial [Planctomycetes bacterium]|nr:hypothetical protein [Planctomycetota bacterium]